MYKKAKATLPGTATERRNVTINKVVPTKRDSLKAQKNVRFAVVAPARDTPSATLPGTPQEKGINPQFSSTSATGEGKKKSGKGWRGKNGESIQGKEERHLKANDSAYNAQFKYTDNYIKTSKYNLLTFLPQNLFEQFTRIANFYFLVLMILQFIPVISSISWYTTAIPLIFVLAVSAAKDGYDDVQRHISDRQVNNRKSYVVRGGRLVEEPWHNVKVGDVIRMMSNQFVAADLFVVSSSEPHGICYIETKELDGETNLKTRGAIPETAEMGDDLDQISAFNGEIVCEAPNNKLDRFQGQLIWQQKTFPITNDQILLRGCILKNTRWCYGVVVFAGKDTKLMMNSGKTKFKRTSLDRFLNVLILGIVLLLLAMCLICTILCGVWEWTTGRFFTIYLPWDSTIPGWDDQDKGGKQISVISFLMFFSYIILLNTLVPISLYVSVEVIRFIHSFWINNDKEMFYENGENSVSARAQSTTLNEELGQVQYVFSDKTGTLTRNIMTFNKCTINGVRYGDAIDSRGNYLDITETTPSVDFSWNSDYEPEFKFYDWNLLDACRKGTFEVTEFFRLLALCHTVMPERDNGRLVYQAQSPDEAALTSAARNFGFVFRSRTPQSITISLNGVEEVYELLCILDFNNDRKRMSVITRNSQNKIRLYCKGADMMVMARLSPSTSPLLLDATNQHLADFAAIGLRTLCLAYKDIDNAAFDDWMNRQREAAVDMYNRDEKLDALYEEMERNLTLLGATAIEDKLQDGVPEAIARLAAANIKIWVLTGDKTVRNYSINIAYSCHLLTDDMSEIMVIDGHSEQEVDVQLRDTWRAFDAALAATRTARFGCTTAVERYIDEIINYVREIEKIKDEKKNLSTSIIDRREYRPIEHLSKARPPTASARMPERFDIETIHEEGEYANNQNGTQSANRGAPLSPNSGEGGGVALVINGDSLGFALTDRLAATFLEIACKCQAVICCRVTPLQKAQVVDLVKRNKKAVTLSIGDGANDVSMIKTAHIGVGISGQEGMQAVLASDYSIGQFKYLERLLLVHGRWSYIRMCKFLSYFFYKNFSFTLTHFWYSFFCGYSAQTVFDAILIACYNLFFTALPVLAMGALDQDVDADTSLRFPKLYLPGQYNLFFNMRIFIYSVLQGMISSLVIFFVPYGTFIEAIDPNGRDLNDYPALAFTAFTALFIVVTIQICLDTYYWTAITHIVLWGSIFFYFALCFIFYEALPFSFLSKTASAISYNVAFRTMATTQFWFSILML
ncbi:unnamed protein product, partial [Mesorhabditis belari]|uniref:Phospholipid-transporting ATPase n=1 Tax=Mesorhabditis belari TaxID=2138241 RepID=A0AAF3FNQ1_9BILA